MGGWRRRLGVRGGRKWVWGLGVSGVGVEMCAGWMRGLEAKRRRGGFGAGNACGARARAQVALSARRHLHSASPQTVQVVRKGWKGG
eukprot:1727481-Pleurochrysis_carterae.AAC.1